MLSSFLAFCPLSVVDVFEKKIEQHDHSLHLLTHNIDPITIPIIKDKDVVQDSGRSSPSGIRQDRDSQQRAIKDGSNQSPGDASANHRDIVPRRFHIPVPDSAMTGDNSSVQSYAQSAPQARGFLYHRSVAMEEPARGRSTRRNVDLPEDPSPPESLMIQREEDSN